MHDGSSPVQTCDTFIGLTSLLAGDAPLLSRFLTLERARELIAAARGVLVGRAAGPEPSQDLLQDPGLTPGQALELLLDLLPASTHLHTAMLDLEGLAIVAAALPAIWNPKYGRPAPFFCPQASLFGPQLPGPRAASC
jgi:hypothetical protein